MRRPWWPGDVDRFDPKGCAMNQGQLPASGHGHWTARLRAGAALAAAAWLLAACGGGGDAGPTPPPPAAPQASNNVAFANGAIEGFGSVFVGGVRFDDSAAAVTDEDGNPRDRNALRLGMMVDIDSGTVDRVARFAVAARIRFGSEIVGPASDVDAAASTLKVLGQNVVVTTSTVFDETLAGGLAAVANGAVLEVHGILDVAGAKVVATRIEPKADATGYKLRGAIANLDTTARTFTINGERIGYAGVANPPPNLANGRIVRVALQTTPQAGTWIATRLVAAVRLPDQQREAQIEGAITAFTSSASFSVNGLAVDAANATFPDGTAGLVLGARVEVTGSIVGGVLVAARVELKERRDWNARPMELRGDIGNLNTTNQTFALRGVTVWYGGQVSFQGGGVGDLSNGRRVEVTGSLSSDRTRLEARRIQFR
jgi:hypothetical protein